MKVVITGHMSGLGLALTKKFTEKQYDVLGYDLLNDKDINNPKVIEEIVKDCTDADIFVNNAIPNQSPLLIDVFNKWIGEDKTIINISSATTYLPNVDLPESMNDYISQKKILDKMVHFYRGKSQLPHIMNIRPGWFESNLVKEFNTKKMNPEDIANLIVMLYDMKDVLKTSDIVLEK